MTLEMPEVRLLTFQSRAAPSFGQRRVYKNRHAMPLICNATAEGRVSKVRSRSLYTLWLTGLPPFLVKQSPVMRLPDAQSIASLSASGYAERWLDAQDKKIVGMGSAGLDYLAQVAAFPEPDQKLRTENLQVDARARFFQLGLL